MSDKRADARNVSGTEARLAKPFGSRLDRTQPLRFTFEGHPYVGFKGDTVASALAASGQFVLSRSFKYHRARGAVTMAGHDANTLVQTPDNPNALADREPLTDGLSVNPVNVSGSLMRDRYRLLGWLSRFLPVGFYYKAFFRPKGAWTHWVKLFRPLTGLGRLDVAYRAPRYDKRYRFVDVLVVGGGVAGMAAAANAASYGLTVMLVDEQPALGGAHAYARVDSDVANDIQSLSRLVNQDDRIEVLTDAVANGWFSDHWVPVVQHQTLHKVRARQVILATGAIEQPAVFRNNDLPGVMMASAAQRLMRLYAVKPGRRAVVLTSNRFGYQAALDLLDAGVTVTAVVDVRQSPPALERHDIEQRGVTVLTHGMVVEAIANRDATHIAAVILQYEHEGDVRKQRFDADLLCMAVGFMPTWQLAGQAGAALRYDDTRAVFSVEQLPPGMHLAGAVSGRFDRQQSMDSGVSASRLAAAALDVDPDSSQRSSPDGEGHDAFATAQGDRNETWPSPNATWPMSHHPKGKAFVDIDEDLQIDDLIHATLDGYRDIQLVKRYTTCGMGPSQGRLSALAAARIVAKANGCTVAETGVTTARPPYAAERLAHSAGRRFFPRRLSSMHACHQRAGATFMQAGLWERPAYYSAANDARTAITREVNAVRQGVGLIDVSTLGGLDIRGSDAAEFINRLYTWGFVNQPVGRARYALMTDEAGVVIDDGVACRFATDHYYVTATTSGVDRVYRNMLKWNAQWRLDVDISNVTGAWGAVNLAGPRARDVLQRVCDLALDADDFGYMAVRTGAVAGIEARLLRVGFVGELGYEIHVPQSCGEALWERLMEAGTEFGITPFGVEAQRVMRLEKGHIIIGQDTDAMSNPYEVSMGWAVSTKKPFFVGHRTLRELYARGIKRRLVGFALDADEQTLPKENQLVLKQDAMIGRVTSCAESPTLGYAIGLAYVPYAYSEDTLCIKCDDGQRVKARIVSVPFYDPSNERQAR